MTSITDYLQSGDTALKKMPCLLRFLKLQTWNQGLLGAMFPAKAPGDNNVLLSPASLW